MSLDTYIRERLTQRPILLMSHLVLGYPSLADNARVIDAMVAAGVELMELQFPFSEPTADGPVIARANQAALDQGFKVREGLAFAAEVVRRHPIPFLVMTYYNILHAFGVEAFIEAARAAGIRGLIIPDLPVQEADEAMAGCRRAGMDWIQLMTPTSDDARLREIGAQAGGFVYCVARKGVTGKVTDFNAPVAEFIDRCRLATDQPLAVGFGVRRPEDVAFLQGRAEIAVVGTASIELNQLEGAEAVGRLFAGLRG